MNYRSKPVKLASVLLLAILLCTGSVKVQAQTVNVSTPMAPPTWAVLERQLLDQQHQACLKFYERYFDSRGFLECVERWGGDDGPDDAIENVNDWPILHAVGGHDDILTLYKKAWEGHLRQYTLAKTVEVPFARDGMYYKEFPVMFDWVHNGEGLTVFNLQGLSDPYDSRFQQRVKRFAGFYLNEDPGAQNYDYKHKIIRSMFNGSRGPLLRKATALDWTGDSIEVENRFLPRHGEENYAQMLAHFEEYNDIVGDHPQNMGATSLAFNAYALTQDSKYKKWLVDYVDAWLERTYKNGGVIPTNIGLDGKIGGEADGKWYGGVYGWGFSVTVPQTGELANRNTHYLGLTGFANAMLLTGDHKYIDVWRNMIEVINSNAKVIDGKKQYPRMYGDHGWYAFTPSPYASGALEIYYWTLAEQDKKRVVGNGWVNYLSGNDPDYPTRALTADFSRLRTKMEGMRNDPTTPDTRLSDDPMPYNPAIVGNLINLTMGGLHPGHKGAPLHCRVRYFDPLKNRAGLPQDVAALVTKLDTASTELTLVNLSQTESRTVIIQGGAYGEHQIVQVTNGKTKQPVDATHFSVRLEPGCGTKLQLKMQRYQNQPTMDMPLIR